MNNFETKPTTQHQIIAQLYTQHIKPLPCKLERLAGMTWLYSGMNERPVTPPKMVSNLLECTANTEQEVKAALNASYALLRNAQVLNNERMVSKDTITAATAAIHNDAVIVEPTAHPFIWKSFKACGLAMMPKASNAQAKLMKPRHQPDAFAAVNHWQSVPFSMNPVAEEIAGLNGTLPRYQQVALLSEAYNTKSMFFPSTFDPRTRNYLRGALNPSNTGDIKGMFSFSESRPVDAKAIEALQIHHANLNGIKGSLNKRIAWSVANTDQYLLLKGKTKEELQQLTGERKVIQLYTVAKEVYLISQGKSESNLIVNQDATCSGIQIAAAILRNRTVAEQVNLCASSADDKPQDIYTDYLDKLRPKLPQRFAQHITRGMGKPLVMFATYGAGKQTLLYGKDGLIEFYTKADPQLADELEEDEALQAIFLDTLTQVIHPVLALIQAIRKSLKDYGNRPITWLTHDRLPITMQPEILEPSCFDRLLVKKGTYLTLRNGTAKAVDLEESAKKQSSSLAVNFVHSLDATHVRMISNACKAEGIQIVHTHDDIGTHAADYWRLKEIIAEQFEALHSTDVLASLRDRNGLAIHLPRGDYDLSECRASSYMFN